MSILTQVKGIVNKIEPLKTTKNNNYIMEMIIRQPATQNDFGETFGTDNFYRISLFMKNEEDLPKPDELLNRKIIADCYLNGSEYITSNGLSYSLNLRIRKYALV